MTVRSALRGRNFALLVAGMAISACTHLETRPTGEIASVEPGRSYREGAQRGLSYALPMLQYDLEITRSLEECPTAERPWPKITAKVAAAHTYVAGERFEVDYQSLSSIMKSTSFDVGYHETGTLKSINTTAKDKTGPLVADVARIGLAVASVASGIQVPANIGAGGQFAALFNKLNSSKINPERASSLSLACSQEAITRLAALKEATSKVKTLNVEVDALVKRFERFTSLAALKITTAEDNKEIAAAARSLIDKEQELLAARAALAAAQDALSVTEERTWPAASNNLAAHQGLLAPDAASVSKLWSLFEVKVDNAAPLSADEQKQAPVACGARREMRSARDCIADIGTLKVALMPVTGENGVSASSGDALKDMEAALNRAVEEQGKNSGQRISRTVKSGDRKWAKGVFIREPAQARLVVCLAPARPGIGGCNMEGATVLNDKIVVAPQFGRLRLLPFTNGPFEDNALKLSLRPNGLIEAFTYGQESSASAVASNLASVAEKAEATIEKMEEERRSDIKYARETQTWNRTEAAAARAEELAILTSQIDQTKKQLELLRAQADLAGAAASIQLAAEVARLEGELKSLQAQVAKVKAARELETLMAGTS
jgi:hypothetical protein